MAAIFAVLALGLAGGAAAAETDDAAAWKARFGSLAQLAGRCWSGRFEGSDARDLRCWEWALGERFLRDSHRVIGGQEAYSGETWYGWDAGAGAVRFWYFNSLGGVSSGTMTEQEGRVRFDESYGDDSRSATIRSWIELPDANHFTMVSERRVGAAWEPFMSVSYESFGLRPARIGGEWAERWDLVFSTNRDGDYEVYRRDLRTGEERNLTAAPGTEWAYAGGREVVVVSDRPAGAEPGYRLYRLDPATGELDRLSDRPVADSWLGVLPGGGLVVCGHEAGDKELFLLAPDGAVERRLTDNDADDCQPDVTPDGETVVFWSNRGGSAEIWAMPVAGGEARQLTRFAGNDSVPGHRYGGEGPPRVSPDGRRIVWMSIRDGSDFDVYSMAIDGSDVRRLTEHLADDGYPSWSPDGRWIAFDSDRHGGIDLFVMRSDGSEPTRVSDAEGSEQAPVWVPLAPPGAP